MRDYAVKILVIGGTSFIGKHIVTEAKTNGHEITLFNRGLTDPSSIVGMETITGDRDTDLYLLDKKEWDAVIDTCGYDPISVDKTVSYLNGRVSLYVFVSSVAVYERPPTNTTIEVTEESPIYRAFSNKDLNSFEQFSYNKAMCEQVVLNTFKESALIVRPSMVTGEGDPTNRLAYWLYKFLNNEDIIIPGPNNWRIEYIDVKDLSSWLIKTIEENITGIFNLSGPSPSMTAKQFFNSIINYTKFQKQVFWIDENFLIDNGTFTFYSFPLWIPRNLGVFNINYRKAITNGYKNTSIINTLQDLTFNQRADLNIGINTAKEQQLIKLWQGVTTN